MQCMHVCKLTTGDTVKAITVIPPHSLLLIYEVFPPSAHIHLTCKLSSSGKVYYSVLQKLKPYSITILTAPVLLTIPVL